jgi:hypothetical protein
MYLFLLFGNFYPKLKGKDLNCSTRRRAERVEGFVPERAPEVTPQSEIVPERAPLDANIVPERAPYLRRWGQNRRRG